MYGRQFSGCTIFQLHFDFFFSYEVWIYKISLKFKKKTFYMRLQEKEDTVYQGGLASCVSSIYPLTSTCLLNNCNKQTPTNTTFKLQSKCKATNTLCFSRTKKYTYHFVRGRISNVPWKKSNPIPNSTRRKPPNSFSKTGTPRTMTFGKRCLIVLSEWLNFIP